MTPAEGGALVLLERLLADAGFACTRVDRGGIANLFARWGARGANRSFGFNGHTDVVPVGDAAAWTHDPFGAEVVDGWMYGRGATDMKSGVAAFAAAAMDFVRETPPDGAVILAITGDEEGEAQRWHRGAAGLDGRQRRADDALPGGRADLPERDGRDDEDRAARVDDLLVHRRRACRAIPPIRTAPRTR